MPIVSPRASILDLSTSDCKATDSPDGKVPPTWTSRRRDSGSMAVCFGESACRKLTYHLAAVKVGLEMGGASGVGYLRRDFYTKREKSWLTPPNPKYTPNASSNHC